MGIHSAFLGSSGTSTITAQSTFVNATRLNSCSAGFQFTSSGSQLNIRNSSQTIVGNWVTPPSTAPQWEIRAILTSGDTPEGDALNTWLPFTVNRSWFLQSSVPNSTLGSILTFEFRRVGGTAAEFSIADNSISIEVLDGFN